MPLNQNEDPNFERRLILAFALSVLLFLVFLPYLNKQSKMPTLQQAQNNRPAPTAQAPATAPAQQKPETTPAQAPKPKPGKPGGPVAPATTQSSPTVAAAAEQQVTVDTPVYHIAFSNRGASARAWVLTQYKDDAGKPLNLVDPEFSNQHGYPLAFWTPDAGLRQQLDQALYQARLTKAPDGSQTLTFTWSNGDVTATKTLRFGAGYVADVTSAVTRAGQPLPMALAWPGAFGDRAVPGDFNTEQLFHQSANSVQTLAVKKVENGNTDEGVYQFAGVEDQFFAAAFLPNNEPTITITRLKSSYQPKLRDASGNVITNNRVDTVGLAVSDGAVNDTRLFVGPKKIDLLKAVDPALRGLVDFGWFTFIAEPLFLWMNWTYVHWIHNYGWVILFLTFVLTMATFPLKMKAQKSQSIMMALQPKINALNAKAKKYGMRDPRKQEVQQEIMKLYSTYGANPLGGCLPMLIVLPLIYAFWRVLDYAIELRHAPWFGYIHDLSAKDPYFVLPLLVVVTQFFSMSFMPTTPGQDPRQAKMMKWMMPIVMGWFFFYLPSGVNLYYLGYNIVSTGQQWVANKAYNEKAIAIVAAKDEELRQAGKKKVIEGKVVSPKR
ncbi:MAG TPA: membrane protein insertase YidC [Terriglobales bacterium]|nr:membrane protein insertase YidC [Terriglobales bacterium]